MLIKELKEEDFGKKVRLIDPGADDIQYIGLEGEIEKSNGTHPAVLYLEEPFYYANERITLLPLSEDDEIIVSGGIKKIQQKKLGGNK